MPTRGGGADRLSYRALDEQSDRAARVLRSMGTRPGQPVGLCMDKSPDAIVAALGVLKAGACYVPLDPFSPVARSAPIVRACEIRIIVTRANRTETLAAELRSEPQGAPSLQAVIAPGAWETTDDDAPLPQVTESHLAYILHTSGSTGVPKGVAISHRNALAFVEMAGDYFGIGPEDRLAGHAPLHFDLSVFDLYCALRAGASVVLIPEYFGAFPKKMVKAIAEHQITVWNSVVSALTLMLDRGKLERESAATLRTCIFSGELMPMRTLRALRTVLPDARLYNVYGQTEANSSLVHPVTELPTGDDARPPIGRVFPNFDVFARTENGEPVEGGSQVGELHVAGPTVARGYFGDPERTSERFVQDPREPSSGAIVYRTGDLVRQDSEGAWHFVSRVDNLIKTRGYRVELGEIELALAQQPGIAGAVVVAIPDDSIGHRLVGVVVPDPTADQPAPDPASLLQKLAARLPKYMVPESLRVLPELPTTSTGKPDRKLLLRQLVERD